MTSLTQEQAAIFARVNRQVIERNHKGEIRPNGKPATAWKDNTLPRCNNEERGPYIDRRQQVREYGSQEFTNVERRPRGRECGGQEFTNADHATRHEEEQHLERARKHSLRSKDMEQMQQQQQRQAHRQRDPNQTSSNTRQQHGVSHKDVNPELAHGDRNAIDVNASGSGRSKGVESHPNQGVSGRRRRHGSESARDDSSDKSSDKMSSHSHRRDKEYSKRDPHYPRHADENSREHSSARRSRTDNVSESRERRRSSSQCSRGETEGSGRGKIDYLDNSRGGTGRSKDLDKTERKESGDDCENDSRHAREGRRGSRVTREDRYEPDRDGVGHRATNTNRKRSEHDLDRHDRRDKNQTGSRRSSRVADGDERLVKEKGSHRRSSCNVDLEQDLEESSRSKPSRHPESYASLPRHKGCHSFHDMHAEIKNRHRTTSEHDVSGLTHNNKHGDRSSRTHDHSHTSHGAQRDQGRSNRHTSQGHKDGREDNYHDTNYKRSASSYDEAEVITAHPTRHDSSLSRRSSSSRSNQDTGFASSSSSPRRDDTISRFSSDVSPSRFGEEDINKHHDDTSSRKRKSRLVTDHNGNNNSNRYESSNRNLHSEEQKKSNYNNRSNHVLDESQLNRDGSCLDVPLKGSRLHKDRSLSSSGRGDSSLDEPYLDNDGRVENRRRSEVNNTSSAGVDNSTDGYDRVARTDKKPVAKPLADGSIRENTSPAESAIEQQETPKALSKADVSEWASSTSTLRGGNVPSRTSVAGSISSLLSRDPARSGASEKSFSISSVSERWKKLREGMASDQSRTSKFAAETALLLESAASRFMSSFPLTSNSRPKDTPSPRVSTPSSPPPNPTQPPPSKCSSAQGSVPCTPPTSLATENTLQPPHQRDTSSLSVNRDNANSSGKRESVASALSAQQHRASACTLNSKPVDLVDESPDTDSEKSGDMTPPPLDTEMKRRSKDVDAELTSFLPAEMSRREEKFHDAAKSNDASAIRAILKEKVNINCKNSLDRTALHWAAANGNLDALEALIEGGADVEAKDKYGMRAVLWSAWFGHIPVLRALVNAGANTQIVNKQGLGILHCASENNHVAVISFIFESLEQHDVNRCDKNERTALHSAAESGNAEAVGQLLLAHADLHRKDKGGMTAVHLAAKHGHQEVLKRLLLQGVEVDDRDVNGMTALHLAAEAGHKDIADLLLDYTANPNSETIKEITPLHLAATEGHVGVCQSLVKYGCNVNAQNFQGSTALHLASKGNHKDVAKVLVDAKSELDLPNTRLQTSLHVAVENGHLEVVQILLAGGASLEAREKSGKSALQLAARGNYVSVVDMLIKAERYYALAREYHDKDVGYVDPDTYLRHPQHPNAANMKEVLWKLATKQLKPTDWKKLAFYWHFTPDHIKAIEQEYTGSMSYKDHGYRLLLIWLHGIRKDENVLKLLFEALVGIEKRQLAEHIRRKVNMQTEKPCSPSLCRVS